MSVSTARGRTVHTVAASESDCYRTIGDAVTAARSGDVVSVRPGTYRESLVLDRNVTISAAGAPGEVRIESNGSPVVLVACEDATLSGLVLVHEGAETSSVDIPTGRLRMDECVVDASSAAAVWCHGEAELRAYDCVVRNRGKAGAIIADGATGEVARCRFESAAASAVVVRTGANPVFRDCTITDAAGSAVLAADGAHGVFEDCLIERAGNPAVAVESGSTTALRRVTVVEAEGAAFLVASQAAPVLTDCAALRAQGQGLVLLGCGSAIVERFTVKDCRGYGIHVLDRAGGTIRDSRVSGGVQVGAMVGGEATTAFESFEVEGVDIGVVVTEGSRPAFEELVIRDATTAAVRVTGASTVVTGGELARGRGCGVEVEAEGTVVLEAVVLRRFAAGIVWRAHGAGTATECTIEDCPESVVVESDRPVVLERCRLPRVPGGGMRVDGPGTNVSVIDCGEDVAGFGRPAAVADDPDEPRPPRGGRPKKAPRSAPDETDIAMSDQVVSTSAAAGSPRLRNLLAQLDSLIGLAAVKREVETLVRLHLMAERRSQAGLPAPPLSRHLVFTGSPGTGKTTVARLYGQIMAEMGVIEGGQLIETGRPDLVASVIGGTALKTTERVTEALGGVLFIDEAYTLSATATGGPDFGREAVDTLVKLMEDHRDELVVIVAGYTHEMRSFLATNPGLASRFSRTIEFADYTAAELVSIVEGFCQAHDYRLEFETRNALLMYFERLPRDAAFGNGRSARKVFEEMLGRQAYRLAEEPELTGVAMTRLLPEDIGELPSGGIGAGAGAVDKDRVERLLAELRDMVGLENVKHEVEGMIALLASAQQRKAAGLPAPQLSRHLIFAGPPGTGKTTIARLYAEVLAAMGVLARGQVIEVGRSDLVAAYVGQTAQRTAEAFDRARGGVLFIDEAYTLSAQAGGGADFGREAIDTLVKLMEDHRDEVVVIAAGYEGDMEKFLAANQGLASRFSHRIRFGNYSTDELVTIVNQHAAASGYECDGPTISALRAHLAGTDRGPSFGNGRYARQLLDEAITRHAKRMRSKTNPSVLELVTLTPADIPAAGTVGSSASQV